MVQHQLPGVSGVDGVPAFGDAVGGVGFVFRVLFLIGGPKFERDNGTEDGDTE